jgi:RNA polymerase sigma-70 factor (ECF subfamily)
VTSGEPIADAVLARRAAEGDERAFADLVRRHKAPLYRLLRRYTGDSDEAHEAAHEAFIAAWAALHRYDPKRPFLAWLRTIAINKARDRSRRMAFRRLLFGAAAFESTTAIERRDRAAPADDAMIQQQEMAALDHAVSRLSASLKAPLILTAFEGLSQKEAADILGVSTKAIETRTRRARQTLARALDPALRPNR